MLKKGNLKMDVIIPQFIKNELSEAFQVMSLKIILNVLEMLYPRFPKMKKWYNFKIYQLKILYKILLKM